MVQARGLEPAGCLRDHIILPGLCLPQQQHCCIWMKCELQASRGVLGLEMKRHADVSFQHEPLHKVTAVQPAGRMRLPSASGGAARGAPWKPPAGLKHGSQMCFCLLPSAPYCTTGWAESSKRRQHQAPQFSSPLAKKGAS